MKKTLITIFALGSVAAADITLYDATFADNGKDTLTGGRSHLTVGSEAITLSSWMIEFQITKLGTYGSLFSTCRNLSYEESGEQKEYEYGGLGVYVGSSELKITKDTGTTASDKSLAVSGVSTTNPITLRFAYDESSQAAYLYNVGTGEYVSATGLSTSEAYKLTTVESSVGDKDVNGKSMFWTYGGGTQYKLLKITDMSSLAGTGDFLAHVTAPEPTTATLSLLALVGLAARRRRKQP